MKPICFLGEPLPEFKWDLRTLQAFTAKYETGSTQYGSWKGMMGPRGKVDEKTHHVAAAAAWGLSPEWDATYLNYSGDHDCRVCHKATYHVPVSEAFWSITVYGKDGSMKSEDNIVNSSDVKHRAAPESRFLLPAGAGRAGGGHQHHAAGGSLQLTEEKGRDS